MTESSSRRTWVSVLIAAVIVVGILAATAIGGTAFFFYRHVHSQFTPRDDAAKQFASARERFAGQQALIEIRHDDQRALLHREVIPAEGSPARLAALRVMAYDTRGGKLVNISIPFWLLRMAPSNKFSFLDDYDFDTDRMRLTVEDLERRGPGLILDQSDRRGSQVLVWTE